MYILTPRQTVQQTLHPAEQCHYTLASPIQRLMTKGAALVAYGCNNCSTVATVTISAKIKDNKKTRADIKNKTKTKIAAKKEKKTRQCQVRNGIQVSCKDHRRKSRTEHAKKRDETYQDVFAFPETGEISLFKSKNYKLSVSIIFTLSCMRPNVCAFDTGGDLKLIRSYVLEQNWLHNFRQSSMPEI